MKLFKLIFVLLLLASAGGFGYLAIQDVDIEQTPVKKTIPNERFFDS